LVTTLVEPAFFTNLASSLLLEHAPEEWPSTLQSLQNLCSVS
jgi:hypothetical protein